MVGRNDACPCGSGLKYKKCCGKTNVVNLSVVIDGELERIMEGFANEGLSSRAYGEMDVRVRKWMSELRSIFEPDLIEAISMDSYYYLEHADIWTGYLDKQIAKQRRQQVINVLKDWRHPFLMLGKITGVQGDRLVVRDELRNEDYTMPGGDLKSVIGEWLFGIVLLDPREGERGLVGTSGIVFIPKSRSSLVEQLIGKMKAKNVDYLDLYTSFGRAEAQFSFTPFQNRIMHMAAQYMDQYDHDKEMVEKLLSAFLLEHGVKAKKPEAVAAGAIQVAYEFGLVSPVYSTMKGLATYFGVSSATVSKYRDQIGDFLVEAASTHSNEPPVILMDMGTDPRGTERFMWEMAMRVKHQAFDSIEEINKFMQGKMKEAYEPANEDERVQLLCYRAYEADSEEDRIKLMKMAADINPENADVHLLMAEQETNPLVVEIHLLKAIRSGEKQFDQQYEHPWNYVLNRPYMRARFAYGTWLMTQQKADEAADQFKQLMDLNPSDQQGAGWLLAGAYVKLGLYDDARELLRGITSGQDNAVLEYMNILINKLENKEDDMSVWLRAEKLNRHVKNMLAEGRNPGLFPRSIAIEPGNEDEAKLIYWMFHWVMA
ncbi:SEC-C metal-binding domain-containing protein [Paenisporosarcina quisquiliarum]|uniref:SEC-C metal-binding domain-containing protein n=1 Tax=Paenisporosarcina quisquiliarum TaxID=365346 RepID=A0A9X3LHT8_9BACL|nr:SEC-C metal-binding domain-containing protein [Paenisporosarcina quisquiliarum]MCZ8537276.1 SEC-C metal-binding domain-containing protein [Paenisporosarcina quisquiliarum]